VVAKNIIKENHKQRQFKGCIWQQERSQESIRYRKQKEWLVSKTEMPIERGGLPLVNILRKIRESLVVGIGLLKTGNN